MDKHDISPQGRSSNLSEAELHEAATLASLASQGPKLADRRARKRCPQCGCQSLVTGYRGSASNDGDVEPWGYCITPGCDFEH